MNHQTDLRGRALVSFAVFILLTVAVIAAEAGGTSVATYPEGADSRRESLLIAGLIELVTQGPTAAIDQPGT